MFERIHHLRIEALLKSLDGESLSKRGCLFGGGTAIVLSHAEYRESLDLDFLVSDPGGYRELRMAMTSRSGMRSIMRKGLEIDPVREVRTDQYGIRTLFEIHGTAIKFEIVHEGRIELEPAIPENHICGIATISPLDMATTKLLANSDRWSDDSVFSRDLIDLAMMAVPKSLLSAAMRKATDAYGLSIERDLKKAIEKLKSRPHRLEACMDALKMNSTPRAVLWERIRKLI